jgi:membrane-bound serine protease (ClpP class)
VIPIHGPIEPALASFVKRAIQEAEAKNPDRILFEINTFGGRLDAAFEIVDAITSIEDSTYAYVHQKAISAGALIALAANKIAMGSNTTIGDCAPILQGGEEGIVMAGEKIQSPLRAKFRNLAERNGYPKLLSQSMVSIDMEVIKMTYIGDKGNQDSVRYITQTEWDDWASNLSEQEQKQWQRQTVVAKGELLTMTDTEAQNYGFSMGSYPSREDFLKQQGWTVGLEFESTWSEDLARWLGKIAPLLLLVGFGALYMEFKTPGFGLFGFIGIVCLALVFGSKYAVGLADYTEFLLLMGGVALFVVEIYILPGTFLFGAAGICLFIASLILSMQSFTLPNPELPWQKELFLENLMWIVGSAVLALTVPIFAAKYLLARIPVAKGILESTTLKGSHASSVQEEHPELQLGLAGLTTTALRPYGKALFYHSGSGGNPNKQWEVVALSGYIEAGEKIHIHSIQGNKITVK